MHVSEWGGIGDGVDAAGWRRTAAARAERPAREPDQAVGRLQVLHLP
jgi:hypothetical protein